MATVSSWKCFYCKKPVAKDSVYARIVYGSNNTFRYAHKECFEAAIADSKEQRKGEIIDPNQITVCVYCKKSMNKDDEDCLPINQPYNTKFAHKACIEEEAKREKTPEEELDIYIMNLFNLDFIPMNIRQQKKIYVEKEHLTYSGIKGTLKYFYEVQQHRPDPNNPSIGIVPYTYEQAKAYYKQLAMAKMKNQSKDLTYESKVICWKIKKPQREKKKSKWFSFLDEEEVNE